MGKGNRGEGKEKERKSKRLHTERERRAKGRETKMSTLYKEKLLGEEKPRPWARKFRVGGESYAR